jgi:CheY-like chemotaxis protein
MASDVISAPRHVAMCVRDTDWSQHPLGVVESWPPVLRAALTTCLASRSPMQLWWGAPAYFFYNDAFIPWLGERHPAVLGRRAADVFAAQWQELHCGACRVFMSGQAVEVGGITMQPLLGDGAVVDGLIATFATDRVGEDLLGALVHEVRSPLSALSSVSQLLTMRAQTEAGPMSRSLTQLMRVMDDVFDIARLSRGRLRLQRQPSELAPILDDAVQLVSAAAMQRGANILVSAQRTGLPVFVDRPRLTRALAHLLGEAIEHVVGASVTLVAVSERARIVVSITYPAPEPLVRSIEPGVGHGVSRNLIELHGGTVRFTRRGDDEQIVVELPLAASIQLTASPAPSPKRGRVLVIEDDDSNARWVKMALEQLGYSVVLAHDGPIALQLASEARPDLVLLDIGLPMLDGWEVARRLRDRVGPLPIIAITGRDGPADMHRSSEAGFVEHLNKPLDLERLRRCLAAIEHAPATSS